MIESNDIGMPKRRGRPPKVSGDHIVDIKFDEMELKIASWALRLEFANSLRGGLMDSESRHLEVAKQRTAIIESVIAEMRGV